MANFIRNMSILLVVYLRSNRQYVTMSNTFGTLSWGKQNLGKLSTFEKFTYLSSLGLRQIYAKLGPDSKSRKALFKDLDKIEIPKSSIVQVSQQLIKDSAPDWLLNHSFRTFYWAALLSLIEDQKIDYEILYIASLLHDLALTEKFAPPVGKCFAVHGAESALSFLQQNQYPSRQSMVVSDAIAMHLNSCISNQHTEAIALNRGAALDVVGAGLKNIAPEVLQTILQNYPLLQMKTCLCGEMKKQAINSPSSRISLLVSNGFIQMIEKSKLGR